MHLEVGQPEVSGEGAPCAEEAEPCQLPKLNPAAVLSVPPRVSVELDTEVLVELPEPAADSRDTDPPLLFPERLDGGEDMRGHLRHESFGTYLPDEVFGSDDSLDKPLRSGQPSDRCLRCKLCESSELHANRTYECCIAEDLHSFLRHEATPYPPESTDPWADGWELSCDTSCQFESTEQLPEPEDGLLLRLDSEPDLDTDPDPDSEPDSSTEDSEKFDIADVAAGWSDGEPQLYGENQSQLWCACEDEEECSEDTQHDEVEASDEESCNFSEDTNYRLPMKVYFDEHVDEHVSFVGECQEQWHLDEEQPAALDSNTTPDHVGAPPATALGQNGTDKTYDSEEDGSSDCSSIETKSFKTCAEDSIPSDLFSDLSGEWEEGAQEDFSDDQTQWESFEDEEDLVGTRLEESPVDLKESPTINVAIEDYFDFFDRGDYHGHAFLQRQHYVSCFDGGDIHECLYFERQQAESVKNTDPDGDDKEVDTYSDEEPWEGFLGRQQADSVKNTDPDGDDKEVDTYSDEEPWEGFLGHIGPSSESLEFEEDTEDCDAASVPGLPQDDLEEYNLGLIDVEGLYLENHLDSESSNCEGMTDLPCDGAEIHVGPEDVMCPPYAEDISVEGDAYEDVLKSPGTDQQQEEPEKRSGKPSAAEMFSSCSEAEPYWCLVDSETCEPGVEDYYALQIKSIQTPAGQTPGGLAVVRSCDLSDIQVARSQTGERASVEGPENPEEATEDPYKDFASGEMSIEMKPPPGVIHSVTGGLEDGEPAGSEEESDEDSAEEEECECEYCISSIEQAPLLPQLESDDAGKICVVIDLDETLVHSSFKPVNNADFIIPVEIDEVVHQVYVLKRPHVDEFLQRMGEMFECVLFTASLSKYADPVSDQLDKFGAFRSRLFREACVFHKGNYVKDLSRLGRDLNKVVIVDNSPASYIFHPDNAVAVESWFNDASDCELLELIPFFERLSRADNVHGLLKQPRTSS